MGIRISYLNPIAVSEDALSFYRSVRTLKLPTHLREQLQRAASSVALNLAEGAGRATRADQNRFFSIALGSLRESQAILDLADISDSSPATEADVLGAHIYRLIQSKGR
ncbi:MAG: four helix bundle protein [Deltaproteobacteria bacterium]|nr:four helix bundle protein [Deltaproteobacteria bacterium]